MPSMSDTVTVLLGTKVTGMFVVTFAGLQTVGSVPNATTFTFPEAWADYPAAHHQ
jgi:hypothetical protein